MLDKLLLELEAPMGERVILFLTFESYSMLQLPYTKECIRDKQEKEAGDSLLGREENLGEALCTAEPTPASTPASPLHHFPSSEWCLVETNLASVGSRYFMRKQK